MFCEEIRKNKDYFEIFSLPTFLQWRTPLLSLFLSPSPPSLFLSWQFGQWCSSSRPPLLSRHSSHPHTLTPRGEGVESPTTLQTLGHRRTRDPLSDGYDTPAGPPPPPGQLCWLGSQTGLSGWGSSHHNRSLASRTLCHLSRTFPSHRWAIKHILFSK